LHLECERHHVGLQLDAGPFASRLGCPCRSKLTPNTVRGAFGFGGRAWYGGQKSEVAKTKSRHSLLT